MRHRRNERKWIGEIPIRGTQVVLVTASCRKEAEYKLRHRIDVEAISTDHSTGGLGRILREDESSM